LHDVWPSPGMVHYIYIFKGSCPLLEFCQVQNSFCVQVLPSPILATLPHSSSGRQSNSAAWYKESNYGTFAEGTTYSARQPSRWASAHILVSSESVYYVAHAGKTLPKCRNFDQIFTFGGGLVSIPFYQYGPINQKRNAYSRKYITEISVKSKK